MEAGYKRGGHWLGSPEADARLRFESLQLGGGLDEIVEGFGS